MFNRKKITIGETYLFDVLNETNMANLASLVTVVKKIKYNKYVVISVNNGYIFETKAKYLTPYLDPEKATIVRCQYGTTDFNKLDIDYFNFVSSALEIFEDILKDNNTDEFNAQIIKDFNEIKEWGNSIKDKIQRYVDISDYKDSMKVLGCAYKNLKEKINSTQYTEKDYNPLIEKSIEQDEFIKYFDAIVSDYNNGDISLDDFITAAIEIIKDKYPKNYLINHETLSNDEISFIISNILNDIRSSDSIGFIIGIDDNDNWHIKTIYFTDDSDTMSMINEFKDFVYNIYPELKKNGKCKPKYRFNVLAVSKKGDDEDE